MIRAFRLNSFECLYLFACTHGANKCRTKAANQERNGAQPDDQLDERVHERSFCTVSFHMGIIVLHNAV